MLFRRGGVLKDENDISAKEEIQSKSSWIQSQNEYCRRQKSVSGKKIKRKKEVISLGRIMWPFSLVCEFFAYDFLRIGDVKKAFP